ncbi:MAG: phosphate/phosphite/phosphonate ABC transporter substrate-binding protein [Desulfobulbaceae bacterium]|nr:phosphate/phosphite/phosphonate ABC transporter substrate-binding protein [Desulfobulbaceae bacterium]
MLWIHPYLPATELVKRFTPLTTYLSAELGVTVEIRIKKSYQAHIDFVARDQADLAYLGPVSYLRAFNKTAPQPLLARLEVRGKPVFHGMIIVRQDSPIQKLSDLNGKSFAFGDPNSTMSHIVPRAHLKKAGIGLESLSRHEFLGSHHDVALGVLGGYFDAGGVKEEVFYEYEKRGLRVLAKSPPISEHVFMARSDLAPELVERLRKAFMAVNQDPQKDKILKSIKKSVTGFAPVVDRDYAELRELMKFAESL